MAGGMRGVSLLRVGAIFACLLLAVSLLAALCRRTLTEACAGSRALLGVLLASLLALAAVLESTGKLREAVIAAFGRVPGGLTRLQAHQQAIARFEAADAGWTGEAIPLERYLGNWRRNAGLIPHQVRRVLISEAGGRVRMRIFLECLPAGEVCDAGESEAVVTTAPDGRVAGIAAALPTGFGRVWVKLVPGRTANQPMLMMAHAMVEGPTWQVGTGVPVGVMREKAPAARLAYVGTWLRVQPAKMWEFTRLRVRDSGAGGLAMAIWVKCEADKECDFGEQPAELERDGELVRIVRARFLREDRELGIVLEPPAGDLTEVASSLSLLRYSTGTIYRRGMPSRTYTYESGRNTSGSRVEVRRAGA